MFKTIRKKKNLSTPVVFHLLKIYNITFYEINFMFMDDETENKNLNSENVIQKHVK